MFTLNKMIKLEYTIKAFDYWWHIRYYENGENKNEFGYGVIPSFQSSYLWDSLISTLAITSPELQSDMTIIEKKGLELSQVVPVQRLEIDDVGKRQSMRLEYECIESTYKWEMVYVGKERELPIANGIVPFRYWDVFLGIFAIIPLDQQTEMSINNWR